MTKKQEQPKVSKCDTCIHWNNKQRLLNYSRFTGICVNPKFKFNTTDGRLVGIIDIDNLKDQDHITGNPSHDIETHNIMGPKVDFSNYLLTTDENFGCVYHQKDDRN